MNAYYTPNIIPANTVMNASINSAAIQLQNMFGFAIQVVFTGTPTGTFELEASCDPVPPQNLVVRINGAVTYLPTNWTMVESSSTSVSAAGSVFWNYASNVNWNYVRVQYTDTSGGTSTALITVAQVNCKGI